MSQELLCERRVIEEAFIFVVGSGRCGSTYLAQTLGLHPNIAHFPNETKFMPAFFCWLEDLGLPSDSAVKHARRFLGSVLASFRAAAKKPRLVEKTPANVFCVRWLALCFPKAQFVHIYRDPRDVVASLEKEISKPGVEVAANLWLQHVKTALDKGRDLQHRFLNVAYEDLVSRPVETFEKVFAFLGEDPGPIVEHVMRETKNSAVGRWRIALSKEEVGTIESICGKVMSDLGYTMISKHW